MTKAKLPSRRCIGAGVGRQGAAQHTEPRIRSPVGSMPERMLCRPRRMRTWRRWHTLRRLSNRRRNSGPLRRAAGTLLGSRRRRLVDTWPRPLPRNTSRTGAASVGSIAFCRKHAAELSSCSGQPSRVALPVESQETALVGSQAKSADDLLGAARIVQQQAAPDYVVGGRALVGARRRRFFLRTRRCSRRRLAG